MSILTEKLIANFTLENVPHRLEKYINEKKKSEKIYWYQLLFDKELELEIKAKNLLDEPYFGQSKQAAKSRIANIKKGVREAMTPKALNLIAENMNISTSELLWGKEENWKSFLPSLFYSLLFDAYWATNKKLHGKVKDILIDSVSLVKYIGMMNIDNTFDVNLIGDFSEEFYIAVARLYQPDVQEKFYNLFKEEVIETNPHLGRNKTDLERFMTKLLSEVLIEKTAANDSLGRRSMGAMEIFSNDRFNHYIQSAKHDPDSIDKNSEEKEVFSATMDWLDKLERFQRSSDMKKGIKMFPKEVFFKFLKYEEDEIPPMSEKEINVLHEQGKIYLEEEKKQESGTKSLI